jgi:hypothetical protein
MAYDIRSTVKQHPLIPLLLQKIESEITLLRLVLSSPLLSSLLSSSQFSPLL